MLKFKLGSENDLALECSNFKIPSQKLHICVCVLKIILRVELGSINTGGPMTYFQSMSDEKKLQLFSLNKAVFYWISCVCKITTLKM